MKIPFNWIKDYTDISSNIDNYMNTMIMSGTAIDGYESASPFTNVVVGKIVECKSHENSDHLHVCQVDVGLQTLQIVCGAPNVTENILVPVALVGAELPGGVKIKKGKLRGVESCGMICSGPELNIPTYLYNSVGDKGILIFQENYPLGTNVADILHLDDYILDFDILANRPDCLSVIGLARESAAILNNNFKLPNISIIESTCNINNLLSVSINTNSCTKYMAKMIDNIKIQSSPQWMKSYLYKAGIRSINNIVDITNYVMLETGHPMHAFDYDKLRGHKIIVRNANNNETITTLDEKTYTLQPTDIVICDAEGATGLAGIMGGYESEIDENTKRVVFECAVFNKEITRKTARRLGIRTESSGRFEKGVNPRTVTFALQRACNLINQCNAGEVLSGTIDIANNTDEIKPITTSIEYINTRAGINITTEEVIDILNRLSFTCANANGTLSIIAPKFRQDIEQEADICEEVLRVYGYDKIPSTPLKGITTQGQINSNMSFRNKIATILNGFGFSEAMHYSFIGRKLLEKLNLLEDDLRLDPIKILNPLGADSSLMRSTLVPSMLQTVLLNINRGNESLKLFESSKIFVKSKNNLDELPVEEQHIVLACYGNDEDFYSMRSYNEALLNHLNIHYTIDTTRETYLHPGRTCVLKSNNLELIKIGQLHPDVAENFGITEKVYIAELNIDNLIECQNFTTFIEELPKFPSVSRDIAAIFAEEVPIGPVMNDLKNIAGNLLEKISVFDVYRGNPIESGYKSVAFSFIFRSAYKTLNDDDIQQIMSKIISTLADKYNAYLRE